MCGVEAAVRMDVVSERALAQRTWDFSSAGAIAGGWATRASAGIPRVAKGESRYSIFAAGDLHYQISNVHSLARTSRRTDGRTDRRTDRQMQFRHEYARSKPNTTFSKVEKQIIDYFRQTLLTSNCVSNPREQALCALHAEAPSSRPSHPYLRHRLSHCLAWTKHHVSMSPCFHVSMYPCIHVSSTFNLPKVFFFTT